MTNDASWVFDELRTELDKATKHFPPMKSPHEGWAILKEEVDEMWDEIKRNDFDGALEEALQVAAMAVRYIHDLQDYTPPKAATIRLAKTVPAHLYKTTTDRSVNDLMDIKVWYPPTQSKSL